MAIEAVIFDFDGVIGITMADNHRAWVRAFAHYGIDLPEEEYFLLEGMGAVRVAETILKRRGMETAPATDLAEMKDRYYLQNNTFQVYPCVEELISCLEPDYLLGLVSGAGLGRLTKSLSKPFLSRFGTLVTREAVMNTKPHPEPYLKAARDLGVDPSVCIAVENAPIGIRSAKSAGMVCAALCTTLDGSRLGEADFIFEDHDKLFGFLRRLGE